VVSDHVAQAALGASRTVDRIHGAVLQASKLGVGSSALGVFSVDHDHVLPDDPARVVPDDLRHRVRHSVRPAAVHSPTPAAFLDRLIRQDQETREPQLFSTPKRKENQRVMDPQSAKKLTIVLLAVRRRVG